MKPSSQSLLNHLEANGATHSRALLERFSIRSRATLAKRVTELGDRLVTIGKASSTTYAAVDPYGAPLPLYRISESGKATHIGTLIPLACGEWHLKTDTKIPSLYQGEFKDGLYPGWPWFLADLRPSGFLGRAFAKRMAKLLDFDTNPETWPDTDVAKVLSIFGSNLSGNFVIGAKAMEDVLHHEGIAPENHWHDGQPQSYPKLVNCLLEEGADFGSSAGGEQPKFTATDYAKDKPTQVIVKFSPPVGEPAGRRWGDLLIAEHLANQILSAHGFEIARTRIHEIEARVFLESERFDRIGGTGRRGLVTLRALDAAFIGQGAGTWIQCAERLQASRHITPEDHERIAQLWCFGNLIANTDMHFGNLSFYLGDAFPLTLAPCYDMLPMRFRPAPSGEVPQIEFAPKRPLPEHESAWHAMHPLAIEFWSSVASDPRISEPFQAIARKAEQATRGIATAEFLK